MTYLFSFRPFLHSAMSAKDRKYRWSINLLFRALRLG